MNYRLLAVLVVATGGWRSHSQSLSAKCTPVDTATSATRWGHQHIVMDLARNPMRRMQGTVRQLDKLPLDGATVQVFQRNPSDPLPQQSDKPNPVPPLASCKTGSRGNFFFNVPDGEYEIRVSKAEWMSFSALVSIKGNALRSKSIEIIMRPDD